MDVRWEERRCSRHLPHLQRLQALALLLQRQHIAKGLQFSWPVGRRRGGGGGGPAGRVSPRERDFAIDSLARRRRLPLALALALLLPLRRLESQRPLRRQRHQHLCHVLRND